MRNLVVLFFALFAMSAFASEQEFLSSKQGFNLYYPMPSFNEDMCNMGQVLWNNPFVKVKIQDVFGLSNDAIVISEQPALTLFDARVRVERALMKAHTATVGHKVWNFLDQFTEMVGIDLNGNEEKRNEAIEKAFAANDAKVKNLAENPKILHTIYFNQVTGFIKPDISKAKGVCRGSPGFAKNQLV